MKNVRMFNDMRVFQHWTERRKQSFPVGGTKLVLRAGFLRARRGCRETIKELPGSP